jgi:5-methylcytosine-specific restriction endonuclease McrA
MAVKNIQQITIKFWRTRRLRKQALERDNYCCQKCGKTNRLVVYDTSLYVEKAPDDLDNLITLCRNCRRDWEIYIHTVFGLVEQYSKGKNGERVTITKIGPPF